MKTISKRTRSIKFWVLSIVLVLFFIGVGVGSLRVWYSANLRPVSSSSEIHYFTVEKGAGARDISVKLKREGLIRSPRAFETYVRSNELRDKLQAGTFALSPSMSVQQIVNKIVDGEVAKNLLTILPGKRLDQIKEAFSKAGYSQSQIDEAFSRATYADHPLIANLPPGASLEGFLYPDSFQKLSDTLASTIVRQSLDEMQSYLKSDIVAGFSAQGLNIYQGMTLASIVYMETDDPNYQSTVAQVFLARLKKNMMLQSDTTYSYAADIAGQPRSVNFDSPYNTYLHKGLPPGPIANFTSSALAAVAYPATTDYLYFVSGDDHKTHFSRTAEEHQSLVDQYCKKKCGQ